MNNASLVGIGYTQTLRPGKSHLRNSWKHLQTQWTSHSLTVNKYIFLYSRYEANPLCTGGWEEHQCWWSQTWSGPGVGGMRFCSALINWKNRNMSWIWAFLCGQTATDVLKRWSQNKKKKPQFPSTVMMETFPPASYHCGHNNESCFNHMYLSISYSFCQFILHRDRKKTPLFGCTVFRNCVRKQNLVICCSVIT